MLDGGRADDRLVGGPGNDRLSGAWGADTLKGQSGDDLLFARDGVGDVLEGGAGRDTGAWDRSLDRVRGVKKRK